MKPVVPSMEPAQSTPGYYTYQPPESGLTIHFSLAALDGILAEVMTGFGAIPRRGAEVGGILVGKANGSDIWIEGFAMGACEHRRGPSYLLSEQDEMVFGKTFENYRHQDHYPVGLFRSNTREENVLTDEDRALFGKYFEPPTGTFLLIRPYAAKTSTASFIVYKDGVLPASSSDVFPFQRWELEGGTPPPRRALHELKSRAASAPVEYERQQNSETEQPSRAARSAAQTEMDATASVLPAETPEYRAEPTPAPTPHESTSATQGGFYTGLVESNQRRRGWVWIPLSFIFLLLGVLLGFQSALSFYPRTVTPDANAFILGLSATSKEDNLHVQWNRESPVIKAAQRGRLEIRDGKYNKTVDLDASSLQTGSVMYPPLTDTVGLRMEVTIKGTTSIVELLDWFKKP